MDRLIYLVYPMLLFLLFFGVSATPKGEWNEGYMSLSQTKVLQGFFAICIMFHHISQKTSADWIPIQKKGLVFFAPLGYCFVGFFLFCSGYGLYKSFHEKENYLKGFFAKRVLPVILNFYSTGLIFLAIRFAIGERMGGRQLFYYISGAQLSNPNSWYVIALPIFYLGFFLCFRFVKKDSLAVALLFVWVFIYICIGTYVNHNPWWMRGEWWYNSVHMFPLGVLFAKKEKSIVEKLKKKYVLRTVLVFVLGIAIFFLSEFNQDVYSYYGENWGADHIIGRRWLCLIPQQIACFCFTFFFLLLGRKLKFHNRVLDFFGGITLEFYLIHGVFVELFCYSCLDQHAVFYIRSMPLYVLAVIIPSVPAAVLLKKLHGFILGKGKKKSERLVNDK